MRAVQHLEVWARGYRGLTAYREAQARRASEFQSFAVIAIVLPFTRALRARVLRA